MRGVLASSREIVRLVDWARRRHITGLLEQYRRHKTDDFRLYHASFIVKEIARHLSDALDQTMVLYCERRLPVLIKPRRVLFVCEDTAEKAKNKLALGGLKNLESLDPKGYAFIMARQSNNPAYAFYQELKSLTNLSHNRLHKLEQTSPGIHFQAGPIFLAPPPMLPNHPYEGMKIPLNVEEIAGLGPVGLYDHVIFKLEGIERDAASYLGEVYDQVVYVVRDYLKELELADPGHGDAKTPSSSDAASA